MNNNFILGKISINYISWYHLYIQYLYFMPNKYNARITIDFDNSNKKYESNIFVNNYDIIDEDNIHNLLPSFIDCGNTLIIFKKNKYDTVSNIEKELLQIFNKEANDDKLLCGSIYFIYDVDNSNNNLNVFAIYKSNNEFIFAYNKNFLNESNVKDIILSIYTNQKN